MKRKFLKPVAVALWATKTERAKGIVTSRPTRKRLQPTIGHILIPILIASFAYPTNAVTLQQVLRTTLDNNPAILEAKAGLERAAGQRLVFRSIVWPDFEIGVPAGLQYGHRSGESGIKGFAVGRGDLEQTLFNMAVPPSLRRGDIEVLIAQQQLNVAEIGRASCRERV